MGDGILAYGNVDAAGSGHCLFYDFKDVEEEGLDHGADAAGVRHGFFPGIHE